MRTVFEPNAGLSAEAATSALRDNPQDAAARIAFVAHDVAFEIHVSDPAVLPQLLRYLPPAWQISSSSANNTYSVYLADSPEKTHCLYAGHKQIAKTSNLEEILNILESNLHFQIAVQSPNHLFLHAGVVAWHGRAILIPGRSMAGKTQLVAALVQRGAAYYSDEYAVLNAQGEVLPYPKRLSLRQHNGCLPKRVDAEALGGTVGVAPVPASLILVTYYRSGASWQPCPLSPGQAVLALLDNTVLARARPEYALTTLQKTVSHAIALKGERGEAEEVTESVLELLEGNLG